MDCSLGKERGRRGRRGGGERGEGGGGEEGRGGGGEEGRQSMSTCVGAQEGM